MAEQTAEPIASFMARYLKNPTRKPKPTFDEARKAARKEVDEKPKR